MTSYLIKKTKKKRRGKQIGTVQAAQIICPTCGKGKLKHRAYDIYDCDSVWCTASYWWEHKAKEFEELK